MKNDHKYEIDEILGKPLPKYYIVELWQIAFGILSLAFIYVLFMLATNSMMSEPGPR